MVVSFPVLRDAAINRAFDAIRTALGRVVDLDTAAPFVLLRSPNGTTFKVAVDDAGAVTATAL